MCYCSTAHYIQNIVNILLEMTKKFKMHRKLFLWQNTEGGNSLYVKVSTHLWKNLVQWLENGTVVDKLHPQCMVYAWNSLNADKMPIMENWNLEER